MTDSRKPSDDLSSAVDKLSADDVLVSLVMRYLDSDLLPDESQQLQTLLAADPHNRAVFVEVCLQAKLCAETLGNRLHDAAAAAVAMPSTGPIPIEAQPPATGSALLGYLMSSIRAVPGGEVIVGMLVMFAVVAATWGLARIHAHLTGSDQQQAGIDGFQDGRFVATVTACENCRWGDMTAPVERAARLKPGPLDLQAGYAEITFDGGARVVLEGPALFTLESPGRGNLSIGRVVAYVPTVARGFTITSPSVTVVDLGTEFGLDVDATGCAEVQVFQGQVEAQPTAGRAQGRPLRLEVAGLARFDMQNGQTDAPRLQATEFVRRVEDRAQRPILNLVEEGGSFAANNLAMLPGAWAFGKNVLPGYPHHRIEYLTDGHYGNQYSWISGDEGSSFAGVVLSGPCRIDSIAFGRDNTLAAAPGRDSSDGPQPAAQGFRDRWAGTYTIQYSTAARTNQPPPEDSWHTIDTLKYAPDMPEIVSEHIRPYLRHRFRFAPVRATAVRIVTSEPGTCIDELEVYGFRLDVPKK